MLKIECPNCRDEIKDLKRVVNKEKTKWHGFTHYRFYCPRCNAEVKEDEKPMVWLSPFFSYPVLLAWNGAFYHEGGVDTLWFYVSGLATFVGMLIYMKKRRLLLIMAPSNKRL